MLPTYVLSELSLMIYVYMYICIYVYIFDMSLGGVEIPDEGKHIKRFASL